MSAEKKRLGGMSLSGFKTTPQTQAKQATEEPQKVLEDKTTSEPETPATEPKTKRRTPKKTKLVTVNIKIEKQQQDWLRDTAQTVRDNNDAPVAASDRVYPQHLIGVAVEMLKNADVDWSQIKNTEQLRKALNL